MQSTLFPPASPLHEAERQRRSGAGYTDPDRRGELGQYPTPLRLARLVANHLDFGAAGEVRLLDPGIGMGALSLAAFERLEGLGRVVRITGYEIDSQAAECASSNLKNASHGQCTLTANVVLADYLSAPAPSVGYTHVILNPPYKKLSSTDSRQAYLKSFGIRAPNLCVAFVWKAISELQAGGQLVAIIPRSFANGSYYRAFRKFLRKHTQIIEVCLFDRRGVLFGDESVLQENVILSLRKRTGVRDGGVATLKWVEERRLSTTRHRTVRYEDLWWRPDGECVLRLGEDEPPDTPAGTLDELGIEVSTGPVVDFRAARDLCPEIDPQGFPLLRPRHFAAGRCTWPLQAGKREGAIRKTPSSEKFFWPVGYYVVVRRISSKEEPRRVVASLVAPEDFSVDEICFENHLNVYHCGRSGLTRELAIGLVEYLNSQVVDDFLRSISGHTQINAGDLRALPYPRYDTLVETGKQQLIS